MSTTWNTVILTTCQSTDDSLRAALRSLDGVRIAAELNLDDAVESDLRQLRPDVLFVILGADTDAAVLDRITTVSAALSRSVTLFAGCRLSPEQLMAGMRGGVRECVTLPTTAERLSDVFENVLQVRPQRPRGKLIVFQGAGGGCGTSTLACNTAVEIVRSGRGSVCVVDLDLSTGQLAVMLDVFPKHSLLDVCCGGDINDDKLSGALLEHDSGVKLLARPLEWDEEDLTNMGRALEAVERLVEMFDFVVVDMDVHADITDGGLLHRADEVVLVAQPVTPTIRNAAAVLRRFEAADVEDIRVRLVLNRVPRRPGSVRQDRIEKNLNRSIMAEIPEDYETVSEALNMGVPIADHNAHSKARIAIRDLATALSASDDDAGGRKKTHFLKRMLGAAPA